MRVLLCFFAVIFFSASNSYAKPHIDTMEQLRSFCKPGYQDKKFCKGYWMGVLEMRLLNCEIYKHATQLGDLEKSKAQKLADVLANDFDGISNDDVIKEFNQYYEMNSDKREDRIVLHLKSMFREKYRCLVG